MVINLSKEEHALLRKILRIAIAQDEPDRRELAQEILRKLNRQTNQTNQTNPKENSK